jgi:hypothetical protein
MKKEKIKLAQAEYTNAILIKEDSDNMFNIYCPKCSCNYALKASEWDELTVLEESCFYCKKRVDYILIK